MRWDIIKKAWSLASEKFPDAKSLFVALPDQFRGFGECEVVDLDRPDHPLGKIVYEAKCEDGKPVLSMKLENVVKSSSLPRMSMDLKTSSVSASLRPRTTIAAKDIIAKYPDPKALGEQLAYLMARHEDGIIKLGKVVYHAKTKGDFSGAVSVDVGSDADILGKGFYFGSKDYVLANYGAPQAFEVSGNFANQQQWMAALQNYQDKPIIEQRQFARAELKSAGFVGVDTGHVGVVWDASAIKTASIEIHEGHLQSWIDDHGFPKEAIPHAEQKLAEMGVSIARIKRKRFDNYQKVRVVDPRIMEYNEGAQVMGRRRDKDGHDWYQVIVDGSDKPIWLRDEQLDINSVGSVKDISAVDEQGKA